MRCEVGRSRDLPLRVVAFGSYEAYLTWLMWFKFKKLGPIQVFSCPRRKTLPITDRGRPPGRTEGV